MGGKEVPIMCVCVCGGGGGGGENIETVHVYIINEEVEEVHAQNIIPYNNIHFIDIH